MLRYDQRGAGLSEKVRAQFTNDDAVDDLEGVLEEPRPQAALPFRLRGRRSTQVLRFLERHPEQVASIVLCNPAPGVDPSRAGALNERAELAEKRRHPRRHGDHARQILSARRSASRDAYEAYRGRYLANDPVGFGLAHRMLAMTNMIYMLPKVITCPPWWSPASTTPCGRPPAPRSSPRRSPARASS